MYREQIEKFNFYQKPFTKVGGFFCNFKLNNSTMKNRFLFLSLIIVTTLNSCFLISINPPDSVVTTYSNYLKEGELKVRFNSTDFCDLTYNDTIYAIKGNELRECLSSYKESMVYLWSPFCSAESCLSIGVVQDYCDSNNYQLFVVMEKYDAEILGVQTHPKRPYFSIDHIYHESNFNDKHVKSFTKELIPENKYEGRYMIFNEGRFSRFSNDIR